MLRESDQPLVTTLDGEFWELAVGGLTALQRGDAWAALRRLDELAHRHDAASVNQPTVATTVATTDTAATSESETVASQESEVNAVLQGYSALIASYPQDGQTPQADACAALLDRLAETPWRAPTSLITLTRLSVALPAYNEEAVIAEPSLPVWRPCLICVPTSR